MEWLNLKISANYITMIYNDDQNLPLSSIMINIQMVKCVGEVCPMTVLSVQTMVVNHILRSDGIFSILFIGLRGEK